MGLDASVMCDCFREGRAAEPPVPRDWLEIDEDGYLNPRPGHDSGTVRSAFYAWRKGCCAHPGMDRAWESIANWSGVAQFKEALAKVGRPRFPVLLAELPRNNGGLTAPDRAALALGELDDFAALDRIGTITCLVATATGEVLRRRVDADDGIFLLDGSTGVDVGFDGSGLFVRDRDGGRELFRARRVRQTRLDPDAPEYGPEKGRVVLEDLDTGRTYEGRTAISGRDIPWPDGRLQDDRGRVRSDYPAGLHVEDRPQTPADFAFIVEPLRVVFRASVETGNPVRWC